MEKYYYELGQRAALQKFAMPLPGRAQTLGQALKTKAKEHAPMFALQAGLPMAMNAMAGSGQPGPNQPG